MPAAGRTLTDLLTALRNRVPVASTDTQLTTAVLTEFINNALYQVSIEHDWPWLLTSETISVTSGDSTYATPTDFISTQLIVELATGEYLTHKSRKELFGIATATTGRPIWYSVTDDEIHLRPVPDASYSFKHYYYRMEPTISGSTAPLIPRGYDEGVLEYATFLALRNRREESRAQFARKSYDEWLRRTADNLIESKETRAPTIRRGSQV